MSEAERKLTTILATDVVAFSDIMGRGEQAALHALKTCLGLIRDRIVAHRGRVFGGAGDSLIAEFGSPSSAVKCAVDFQTRIAARNRACPAAQHMWFRVGINLGDVMVDGDNLFGEGVNIAARLQEIGEPAGLCLSRKVHEEIRRTLALTFVDGGEQALKNIARPVRVFHLQMQDPGPGPAPEPATRPGQPVHSLVLRDFTVTGDDEARFLAEGLREGLLNSLSKDSEIGLIPDSPNRDRKVDFILKGSVRGRDGHLRLTFSLIETAGGTQIWSERYDRHGGDLFDLEEEISRAAAAAIRVKLKAVEFERLRDTPNDALSVADLLRKGASYFVHGPGENDKIEAVLRTALAREPDNSMAMAMLTFCLHRHFEHSPLPLPDDTASEMTALAERAVALKSDSYFAHLVLALVAQDLHGDFERARHHARASLDANPDLLGAHGMVHIADCHLGRSDTGLPGLKQVLKASRIDPHRFRHQRELAIAHFVAGETGTAARLAARLVESDPLMRRNHPVHGALLWLRGDTGAAIAAGQQLLAGTPELSDSGLRPIRFGQPEHAADFTAALQAIGLLPEPGTG